MSFEEAVERLVARDARYHAEGYRFLREALDFTVKLFDKPATGAARHVTARELLEGARQYALREYGPMARRVLEHWGIRRTEDIGQMIFQLVEMGVLGRTENDRIEDFNAVYDFEAVFTRPYRAPTRPARRTASAPSKS